jgi:pimeloyl-ACP methyl ester carboxylesterase
VRFTIDIPQATLDDLTERLRRTRLPAPTPGLPWAAGTDPGYLAELVRHWIDVYDWRAAERRLNAHPQFLLDIDGTSVHFVHVKGTGPQTVPLILTHGWPSTFAEMLPLVPLLSDSFDLVIPDLPGFGFSSALAAGPTTEAAIADLWADLMSRLGYARFGVYGGDIGSGVSSWLAALYPDRVIGLHTHHVKFPPPSRRDGLSAAEQAFVAMLQSKSDDDSGYAVIQSTRPDTLAAALNDSPAGLAAWIVEKFQRWSDCDGDVEHRFSKDELLTTVMLFWVTGSINTSFRPYHDDHLAPELPMVDVPVGVTMSVEDAGLPRAFAERVYSDIRYWREPTIGGHFMALEEPEFLAAQLRHFFALVG